MGTENFLSGLTEQDQSFYLTLMAFPIEFSVDWFPSFSASAITKVILDMHNRKWIVPKEDQKGLFSWTPECPRQELLGRQSQEQRAKYYRDAVEILKLNQSTGEQSILEIAERCILAGVRDEDLDILLEAAYLEEKKHKYRSANKYYESILDFIRALNFSGTANVSARHLQIYIKAVERRAALALFYPKWRKVREWLSLAEYFSENHEDKKIKASLFLIICHNYCVALEMKKAIEYLEQAQKIIKTFAYEELYKKYLKFQILVHINNGQETLAVEAYEQMTGSIESFEDTVSLYIALGISMLYTEMGMPQRGLGICEAIRNHLGTQENEAVMSASFTVEGMILLQIRELASSRRCFEQALEYIKKENNPAFESLARISLVCVDYLEGKTHSTSFNILRKMQKHTWYYLLNHIFVFENFFTLYHQNIKRFGEEDLFSFLREIKKEQLFPRTYQMIKRLEIVYDKDAPATDKIKRLLQAENNMAHEDETFELSSTRIELARLYLQTGDRKQAEKYARQAWKFLHPAATKAFPSDLLNLLPDSDLSFERSLIHLLIEMGKVLTGKDNIEQLLTSIISSISRMTGSERTALFIRDDISSELKLVASRNISREDILKKEFRQSLSYIQKVAQSTDSQLQEFQLTNANSINIRKAVITPLMLDEKNIGVLYQESRFFKMYSNQQNREILSALASQIAVAIDRAKAYGEIALLNKKLTQENLYYLDEKEEFRPFGEIVGGSAAIAAVQQSIRKVAATPSTVFIHGETGVGKELVARAIHRESTRRDKPFIRVNCAALPDSLIDSELFGHERGAFTGAYKTKVGRFELANQGTLFLDEISELPLSTQSRLLRILQEKEFQRVGGTKILHSDFRLITASNKDLKEEVAKGRFREDLFYRLNVYPIHVPPLRKRSEDIPSLAMHFLNHFSTMYNKRYLGINESEMLKLKNYAWPGNVRELSNIIERAVVASGSKIKFPEFDGKQSGRAILDIDVSMNLNEREKKITTNLILEALERSGGKIGGKNGAAELLGINRAALMHRIKRLGIKIEQQRAFVSLS